MSFNSLAYIVFLPAVLGAYWLLPRKGQNILLLIASYYFLGFIHPWCSLLIFGVTLVNYLAALAIERWQQQRKLFLWLALGGCLLNLGFFKYADFFIQNVEALLRSAGMQASSPALNILLPVGISFYTFQAMAYSIDVYRNKITPCRNFVSFGLFVSFFPQLVAGPIERTAHLLPQVEQKRSISPDQITDGLMLLVWGFFKKVVIADNTGLIAYKVFALSDPGFWLLWVGVLAFTVQIMADFWSYTDIARGSAALLGFRLSRNFDHPWFSTSPADFWRRWHMSFSYWLRDYVYIPLGGSRVGRIRGYVNIMLTFFLSGLWHGAGWNYIIWGLYHGCLVSLDRLFRSIFSPLTLTKGISFPGKEALFSAVKISITFFLVTVGWLIFRETDLSRLVQFFLLNPFATSAVDMKVACYLFFLVSLYGLPIFIHGLVYTYDKYRTGPAETYSRPWLLMRPLIAACLFIGILLLHSPEPSTFIYFQF